MIRRCLAQARVWGDPERRHPVLGQGPAGGDELQGRALVPGEGWILPPPHEKLLHHPCNQSAREAFRGDPRGSWDLQASPLFSACSAPYPAVLCWLGIPCGAAVPGVGMLRGYAWASGCRARSSVASVSTGLCFVVQETIAGEQGNHTQRYRVRHDHADFSAFKVSYEVDLDPLLCAYCAHTASDLSPRGAI